MVYFFVYLSTSCASRNADRFRRRFANLAQAINRPRLLGVFRLAPADLLGMGPGRPSSSPPCSPSCGPIDLRNARHLTPAHTPISKSPWAGVWSPDYPHRGHRPRQEQAAEEEATEAGKTSLVHRRESAPPRGCGTRVPIWFCGVKARGPGLRTTAVSRIVGEACVL